MKIILQKFIAGTGAYSRRQAEELIRQGKVLVNGQLAELGMRVEKNDEVKVNDKRISVQKEKVYIKLNKPAGYTSTTREFKGEKNVFELIKDKELAKGLVIAGRLDKESRGLILLTNDGELVMRLTHPRYGHEKKYLVKVKECTNPELIREKFTKGIDIEGGRARAKRVKYLGDNKFEIVLTEGKKRQIRQMFKSLRCDVVDLERISIGSLELGNLKTGEWKYLDQEELKMLLK